MSGHLSHTADDSVSSCWQGCLYSVQLCLVLTENTWGYLKSTSGQLASQVGSGWVSLSQHNRYDF